MQVRRHTGPVGPHANSAGCEDSPWEQVQKWKALDKQAQLPGRVTEKGRGCATSDGACAPELRRGSKITSPLCFLLVLPFLSSLLFRFEFPLMSVIGIQRKCLLPLGTARVLERRR